MFPRSRRGSLVFRFEHGEELMLAELEERVAFVIRGFEAGRFRRPNNACRRAQQPWFSPVISRMEIVNGTSIISLSLTCFPVDLRR